MKMKIKNLPAVLLAVITATALILAFGLVNQSYAETGDAEVEISALNMDNADLSDMALPGQTVRLGASMYYDFEGEQIPYGDDLEYKWSLDREDTAFAKIKVNSKDPSVAYVQFNDMPEEQSELDAVIRAKVAIYADGTKLADDAAYLLVSSDIYKVFPDIVNKYLPAGTEEKLFASVRHYTLDKPDGEPVKNVTFTWSVYEPEDATVTPATATLTGDQFEAEFMLKRLTTNDAYISLEAKWDDAEGTRYEFSDMWLKNIPTDLNDYRVTLPDDVEPWGCYMPEGAKISRQHIIDETQIWYDNLVLEEGLDYEIMIYKYEGINEEGDTIWTPYDKDLEMAPEGAPEVGGEPMEGKGFYKVTARGRLGGTYVGETEDWSQYIFMYSTSSLSSYSPDFHYPSSYLNFIDDEPYARYETEPGTELEPTVTLDEKELEEGVDYQVEYVGVIPDDTGETYYGFTFPTEPGLYIARVIGIHPYYGTSDPQYIKIGLPNTSFKASGKTIKVKIGKKKKTTKNKTFARTKAMKVSGKKGSVTYAKSSGNAKITVSKAGKVTVKKGLKKGTYKVKVKVTDGETDTYFAATKTVTVTVKVVK